MLSPLVHTTLPPYEQLLVAEGCGGLLVGAGAGGGRGVTFIICLLSLSMSLFGSTCNPSYEQLLIGMGVGAVSSTGAWCGCGWHWQCPSHEQLLMGMGQVLVGRLSLSLHSGEGGRGWVISKMWQVYEGGGGLPGVPPVFCVPPPLFLLLLLFAISVVHHPGGGVPVFGVVRLHFSLKNEAKLIFSIIE
jgi:hypothetical protein